MKPDFLNLFMKEEIRKYPRIASGRRRRIAPWFRLFVVTATISSRHWRQGASAGQIMPASATLSLERHCETKQISVRSRNWALSSMTTSDC